MVRTGAADAIDPPRSGPGPHLALAGKGGAGHLPALVHIADALGVGHPCLCQEDLVEVDFTAHVTPREDLHARLVQVDEEVGDALAFWSVGTGSSQQHGEVRKMRPCRPYLLACDPPL